MTCDSKEVFALICSCITKLDEAYENRAPILFPPLALQKNNTPINEKHQSVAPWVFELLILVLVTIAIINLSCPFINW